MTMATGTVYERARLLWARRAARGVLRRMFEKQVAWSYVYAYKRPIIQFGLVPIEPAVHVSAHGHTPQFDAVRRSLSAAVREPAGILKELAVYRVEESVSSVKHDPYGVELSQPISAAEDFRKLTTGLDSGQTSPPDASLFDKNRFLYFLARALKPDRILELGSAYGLSGLHLIAALEESRCGHLHTVELDSTRRAFAMEAFNRFFPGSTRWTSLESSFSGALPELAEELAPLDMVFEDGPHTRDVTLEAFENTIDAVRPGGLYIVDDITSDREQEQAWIAIRNDPRIEASLDINARFGVCFRAAGR
jgi:predicted O-methyltransferase YrrM